VRILALADTQLGSGRALADDRLADQAQVLDAIADLAHERDVDVVLHCGDVFESRHPGEEERLVFKRWLAKITPKPLFEDTRRVIIVAGNHDLSNTALASAVDLYDRCEFVRLPIVLDLGGASLACLPWAPIHNLVAARDSRAGVYEQVAEALVAIARDLRAQCPGGKPALLAAHWAISGASLPSGMSVDDLGEVVVPQEAMRGFTWTVAGHIHKAGLFAPAALYTGSPYPCDFGEANEEHGVWILDTEDRVGHVGRPVDDGLGSWKFVPLASRPLVTIDCDLTEGVSEPDAPGSGVPSGESRNAVAPSGSLTSLDETDRIAAAIAAHFPLTDATVRLRYRATEEQARRVDVPALRRLIMDAGAHKVSQVEPTIVRADRARAAGVDETLDPQASLAAWCEANQVEAGKREALAGLLQRWSA
jgi:exonuclease SbcD